MKQLERMRMNLQEYKVLFIVVISVSALLVASPALQRLLVYPQTEFFTELWLLGPEHKAENYPFNITLGENYNVFLGVANHLGHCAYYQVQVKFRNQTQSAADSFNRTPSSLQSLYSINVFVADKESWELPVAFSFDYSYDENNSIVNFNRIMFNNVALNLTGYSAAWDPQGSRFFGNLFFELWIYNDTVNNFQYHERFVSLHLNMTV
jgi:uncharacterized membrane protein